MDAGRAAYCNYDIAPTAMPTLPSPDFKNEVRDEILHVLAPTRPPSHSATSLVFSPLPPSPPYSYLQEVYCAEADMYHNLTCTNDTGSITFTCPTLVETQACYYYDSQTHTWSKDGCTLDHTESSTDADGVTVSFAVCNCSHLTAFSGQNTDYFANQVKPRRRDLFRIYTTALSHPSPNPYASTQFLLFCASRFSNRWKRSWR